MNFIESVQNKRIKELTRLHTKKERDKTGCFLVEGEHLVKEAFSAGCLQEVFINKDTSWKESIPSTLCSDAVLNKLSVQSSQAKIIGLCRKKEWDEKEEKQILLLDSVQDPGNMGTLLRTACAFGIDQVYCSMMCADIYNPKTIQASQGAIFHIPVCYTDLKSLIHKKQAEGLTIYGTSLHERSLPLSKVEKKTSYGIVLGNEGNGVHRELIDACDVIVKIEMHAFESLNVAIAGAILMYEFDRNKG